MTRLLPPDRKPPAYFVVAVLDPPVLGGGRLVVLPMSGAPGEGRPYVVRREDWDALVARAEEAEADLRKALEAAMEAAKQDEANQAKVTELKSALRDHAGLLERYTGRPRDKAWTLQPEAADLMFRTLAALDRQEP